MSTMVPYCSTRFLIRPTLSCCAILLFVPSSGDCVTGLVVVTVSLQVARACAFSPYNTSHICQSHSHTVTQLHSHIITQSHSCSVTQQYGHIVTQTYSHTVTQSPSHTVTQSHNHTVTWSHFHFCDSLPPVTS